MYAVKGTIEKCFDYRFYDDKILVKILGDKRELILYDRNLKVIWSYDLESRLSAIPVLFKGTLSIYEKGHGAVLDMPTGRVLRTNRNLYLFIGDEYSAFISSDKPDTIQVEHADGRVVGIPEGLNSLRFHGKYLLQYSFNEPVLQCSDITTGKLLWKKPYNSFLPGKRVNRSTDEVFVDGAIYLYLYDNDQYSNRGTVCIDLESGSVKQTFEKFGGQLTKVNNKIYTVSEGMNIETLDLQTKQIESHNMAEQLADSGLRIYRTTFFIHADKFFFLDGIARPTDKMGAIDLNTFKLIWNTTLEVADGCSLAFPKANESQLLVYGSDHTLRVLEKI